MHVFKSIKTKLAFGIAFMLLVISTTMLAISYYTYKNAMDEQYATIGNNIARTAISMLEYYDIGYYVDNVTTDKPEEVMESQEYREIIKMLRGIKNSNDILYLYMTVPSEKGAYYVFDTDESEYACPYGSFDEYYEGDFSEQANIFLRGEMIEPIITNMEFGWIISVSYPYFSGDEFMGYVCVDVSMDDVVKERQEYLFNSLMIMIGITVLFAIAYIFVLNKSMVSPIKAMADAAKKFISSKDEEGEESSIISLKVRTGDELEQLCDSMKQMETDINYYIDNLYKITAEKERIGAELNVATQIQSSMLPSTFPAFPDIPQVDIYATMTPAKEVGGDFYDFFMVDDTHLAIVMADVSGKGVPAALFMVIGKTLIKDHTQPGKDLGEVFMEVNNLLCEANSEGLFITAFEGVIDLETGDFTYVNAGHEMPFIYKKDKDYEAHKVRAAFVLAGMEDMIYKSNHIQLEEGDKIFLYTDGIPEATDANNELYGMERLTQVLNANCDKTPAELLPLVKADVDKFVGDAPQFDDLTMLSYEFKKVVK